MLTQREQYRYVSNIDDIIIDGNVMNRRDREDQNILRGEDIVYLAECLIARFVVTGNFHISISQLIDESGSVIRTPFERCLSCTVGTLVTAGSVVNTANEIQTIDYKDSAMVFNNRITPQDEVWGVGASDKPTGNSWSLGIITWWCEGGGAYYPIEVPKRGDPLRKEPILTLLDNRIGLWDTFVINTSDKRSGSWNAVGPQDSDFSSRPENYVNLSWPDELVANVEELGKDWHDVGLYEDIGIGYAKKSDILTRFKSDIQDGMPNSCLFYAERVVFQTHETTGAVSKGTSAALGDCFMRFAIPSSTKLKAHFSNPEYIKLVAPIYVIRNACSVDIQGTAWISTTTYKTNWNTWGFYIGDWQSLDGNGECLIPLAIGQRGWGSSPCPNYIQQLYGGRLSATYAVDSKDGIDINYIGQANRESRIEDIYWLVRMSDDVCNR